MLINTLKGISNKQLK